MCTATEDRVDPRPVCQLLLGDQRVLLDPIQQLPFPLGHIIASFIKQKFVI